MTEKNVPSSSMQDWEINSYLSGGNASYLELLYETYLHNPSALEEKWRSYFQSVANGASGEISHADIRQQLRERALEPAHFASKEAVPAGAASKQGFVDELITGFRRFGHLNAKLDPLGSETSPDRRLQLEHYHLSDADLDTVFNTRGILPQAQAPLKDILSTLRNIYCGTVGVEYSRISNDTEREWLRDHVEHRMSQMQMNPNIKRAILAKLVAAEGLEKYLDSKYPGQKRFSIEGGEGLIPMLDYMVHVARSQNIEEVVFGMAHRGRLNVLMNVMGQSPNELFQEFDGTKDYGLTTGDVKYHSGFSSDINTESGPMHLSLAFNPSHLEFISPVVMGSVRARQERNHKHVTGKKDKFNYAMAVMIHGDAAFVGQGVVMETLSMSQTRAYHIGGTIHIILNNQVGFTTSNPLDARSSRYCSDVAKMIDAPIFHVNADDPESLIKVVQVALSYRMTFHKDIVIDLVCYRRHGHQEVDEPRATQPLMYRIIDEHSSVCTLYSKRLQQEGVVSEQDVGQLKDQYRTSLDEGKVVVDLLPEGLSQHYQANWTPFIGKEWSTLIDTSVDLSILSELGRVLTELPEGFNLQRNVNMIMQGRKKWRLVNSYQTGVMQKTWLTPLC